MHETSCLNANVWPNRVDNDLFFWLSKLKSPMSTMFPIDPSKYPSTVADTADKKLEILKMVALLGGQ